MQTLRDAVDWVQEFPEAKTLQRNIANLESYFQRRIQAIDQTIPALTTSQNPDIQAMVTPLEQVRSHLAEMVGAMQTFLAAPSVAAGDTLKTTSRVICSRIRGASVAIGDNPVYRAYRHYIDQQQLEAQRVTIEFDLEYDEAV